MPYERNYLIELRIFEPLVVHPDLEDYPLSDNRAMILGLVDADANTRLISFPPDPVADSYRGTPIIMTGEDAGDGIARVCPVQDDIRSWHALDALTESTSKSELDALVPKSARRRAAAHQVEWQQGEPDTRVFTRTSAWDVSPVWWLAIDPENDLVITEEDEHGTHVRMRTPILTAAARVEWALGVIREKSRLVAVVSAAESFSGWLDTFDLNSIVELDLGGMSDVIYPETGASLVSDWVDSLDVDDHEGAVAAFNSYTRMWETLGLYSRGS